MSEPNLLLDFHGRRLRGLNRVARFEANRTAWNATGSLTAQGLGNPWLVLRELLQDAKSRWKQGAAIGYVTYEASRDLEPRAFAVDNAEQLPHPLIRLDFFKAIENIPVPEVRTGGIALVEVPSVKSARDFYCSGVEQIKSFIRSGDIYQANLVNRFEVETSYSPAEIYHRLRTFGPAPYSALLEWPDFAVISNSPESFLSVQNGKVTAAPIKGTIRRGSAPMEDIRLAQELSASIKDRAENVMIVDLLRNDLGRVCEYGSVNVPALFELKTFPTLHHLVSTVQGTLRADCDAVDAFLAAFPCGSITGAPKIRAMQILSELEPVPRGVSMGAIGYFGFDGNMEWNVSIRTATQIGSKVSFHAGGGIVADSVPDLEYEEMRLKARALWSACVN